MNRVIVKKRFNGLSTEEPFFRIVFKRVVWRRGECTGTAIRYTQA